MNVGSQETLLKLAQIEKNKRSGDFNIKDEDPNALLVNVWHMELAGKIVNHVEDNPSKRYLERRRVTKSDPKEFIYYQRSADIEHDETFNVDCHNRNGIGSKKEARYLEIELEYADNLFGERKWENSMMKLVKVCRVEYDNINKAGKQYELNLCQWIPEVTDIITEVLIPKYSEKEIPQINTKISIVKSGPDIFGGEIENQKEFNYYKKSVQSSNLKGQFNIRSGCQSGIDKSTDEKVAESGGSGSDEGSKVGPICE
ncbi:hypothetical protein F8M41_008518 [Gigaspora margarita]|uniref:Uncharacterized protein n=1 Tax=Gigaspora margarita TaxID=4874 RepID=A0A8H4EV10_GIGMA|nr:hypothetical protein F8M41_008518 [Gigaspora margarita]